jgi:HlyD family secretion protein
MPSNPNRLDELRIDRSRAKEGRPAVWVTLFILLVTGAAVIAWWWLSQNRAPVVAVALVEAGDNDVTSAILNASGYVTARRRATVSSKVTGKVVDVLVEEGMAVRAGQVLARLDDTSARAYLELAEAQAQAASRVVAEDEVRLRQARLTLDRTRALHADGIANEADLDRAQAEFDSLAARLELSRQQVTVAERQVAVSRAELDNTVIRAPFSGIAISKDAQPGEMVSPVSAGGGFTRTGICTLVDMTSLEIEVDVNESYINRVRPGAPVNAVLDAYPDWRIPAHVITTVPAADRQKATMRVRIGFNEPDPRALPDMGVKVAFLADTEPVATTAATLTVPRAALRKENGQDVVYVLSGERVERRAVTVGLRSADRFQIRAGLSAGERVVIEGPERLSGGERVRVR